jgi:hypothetical protein
MDQMPTTWRDGRRLQSDASHAGQAGGDQLIRPEMIAAADPAGAQLAVMRFRREAEAAANLRSPHTVELNDFEVTDDQTSPCRGCAGTSPTQLDRPAKLGALAPRGEPYAQSLNTCHVSAPQQLACFRMASPRALAPIRQISERRHVDFRKFRRLARVRLVLNGCGRKSATDTIWGVSRYCHTFPIRDEPRDFHFVSDKLRELAFTLARKPTDHAVGSRLRHEADASRCQLRERKNEFIGRPRTGALQHIPFALQATRHGDDRIP